MATPRRDTEDIALEIMVAGQRVRQVVEREEIPEEDAIELVWSDLALSPEALMVLAKEGLMYHLPDENETDLDRPPFTLTDE